MGRKTYDFLPAKFRPLPHRLNVVCSRKPETVDAADGVLVIISPEDFLSSVQRGEQRLPSNQLWIIGGEELYLVILNLLGRRCANSEASGDEPSELSNNANRIGQFK